MKRTYDTLTALEERILQALGDREMYGLEIARVLGMERRGGFSTLYRALHRLAGPHMRRLTARLESPRVAGSEHRPRRRLYRRKQQFEQDMGSG